MKLSININIANAKLQGYRKKKLVNVLEKCKKMCYNKSSDLRTTTIFYKERNEMRLEIDTIYNECRGTAFSSGKKRYYDSAVTSVTTAFQDSKFAVMGVVKGKLVEHSCKIVFDEQGGLYDYKCDCEGFSIESGPCKHVVALALTYEEKNPESKEKYEKRTDTVAVTLISEYGKKRKRKMMFDEDAKIELTPYLSFADGVSLRFSVGRKKHYVIKDIAEFIFNMKNGEYKRYGVDLEFIHIKENFSLESIKLIDFLTSAFKEKTEFGATCIRYKDEISLMTGDVDDFFDLYMNKFVPISRDYMLFVCAEEVPLKITIKKMDDGYLVSPSTLDVKFISGKRYDYLVSGNKIYRVDHSFTEVVKDFMDVLLLRKNLYIAQSDMTLFYNGVIVPLSAYLGIDSDGNDLSKYEAEPLNCKIFIDAKEGGLEASVESSYGEFKFDLLGESINTDEVRDWEAENAIRGIFARYFSSYPRLQMTNECEIFDFLSTGLKELYEYAEVFVMDSMKKLGIRRPPRLHVGVRLASGILNLSPSAEGYTDDEVMQIINAYREKKRYVRLGEGFVDLSDESIAVLSGLLERAEQTEDGYQLPAYYAPYVNDELKQGYFGIDKDSSFKELISSLMSIENSLEKCPETLDDILRNYQKTGYRWLKLLSKHNFGGILADDMGLGKSLQVIALLCSEKSNSIIVCPTTLVLNWHNEIKKFAPNLKTLVVTGTQEERKELIARALDYDVVITSYDLLRRDVELYTMQFDYAIADEAQFIKNPDTKNAISLKRLKSVHRFALTGTPIENHLGELWSIFDFIMPMYLGSYRSFREKFEEEILRQNENAKNRLKRLVMPFVLRRVKSEVLTELPPKIESVIPAQMGEEQKKIYDANFLSIKNAVGQQDYNTISVLSMLTKLRQICCDPSLIYPEYDAGSAKLDACMDLIRSAVDGGHKILLFSQYTSMLDILRKKLASEQISFYTLKGDTPKTDRVRMVNMFNNDDTSVFLISLKAGGTGLNLTGADVVIHYDPWWNQAVMNQATDRAYRIGQDRSVQVYKLILKDTLEEKIMELQSKKSELSTSVIGEESEMKEILKLIDFGS